jgi:hypothetical protein
MLGYQRPVEIKSLSLLQVSKTTRNHFHIMSDNYDEESNAGAPVSSFQTYAAEGDLYGKQGDVRKAIEAYTKVCDILFII